MAYIDYYQVLGVDKRHLRMTSRERSASWRASTILT